MPATNCGRRLSATRELYLTKYYFYQQLSRPLSAYDLTSTSAATRKAIKTTTDGDKSRQLFDHNYQLKLVTRSTSTINDDCDQMKQNYCPHQRLATNSNENPNDDFRADKRRLTGHVIQRQSIDVARCKLGQQAKHVRLQANKTMTSSNQQLGNSDNLSLNSNTNSSQTPPARAQNNRSSPLLLPNDNNNNYAPVCCWLDQTSRLARNVTSSNQVVRGANQAKPSIEEQLRHLLGVDHNKSSGPPLAPLPRFSLKPTRHTHIHQDPKPPDMSADERLMIFLLATRRASNSMSTNERNARIFAWLDNCIRASQQ